MTILKTGVPRQGCKYGLEKIIFPSPLPSKIFFSLPKCANIHSFCDLLLILQLFYHFKFNFFVMFPQSSSFTFFILHFFLFTLFYFSPNDKGQYFRPRGGGFPLKQPCTVPVRYRGTYFQYVTQYCPTITF